MNDSTVKEHDLSELTPSERFETSHDLSASVATADIEQMIESYLDPAYKWDEDVETALQQDAVTIASTILDTARGNEAKGEALTWKDVQTLIERRPTSYLKSTFADIYDVTKWDDLVEAVDNDTDADLDLMDVRGRLRNELFSLFEGFVEAEIVDETPHYLKTVAGTLRIVGRSALDGVVVEAADGSEMEVTGLSSKMIDDAEIEVYPEEFKGMSLVGPRGEIISEVEHQKRDEADSPAAEAEPTPPEPEVAPPVEAEAKDKGEDQSSYQPAGEVIQVEAAKLITVREPNGNEVEVLEMVSDEEFTTWVRIKGLMGEGFVKRDDLAELGYKFTSNLPTRKPEAKSTPVRTQEMAEVEEGTAGDLPAVFKEAPPVDAATRALTERKVKADIAANRASRNLDKSELDRDFKRPKYGEPGNMPIAKRRYVFVHRRTGQPLPAVMVRQSEDDSKPLRVFVEGYKQTKENGVTRSEPIVISATDQEIYAHKDMYLLWINKPIEYVPPSQRPAFEEAKAESTMPLPGMWNRLILHAQEQGYGIAPTTEL